MLLNMEDVDTDQIILARFLKATTREGFGDNLFRDWRFNADNSLKENFVLNDKTYNGKILVVGNFKVKKTIAGSLQRYSVILLKSFDGDI